MRRFLFVLMLVVFFGAAAGPVSAAEETVKLKMADYFPIGHLGHKTALRFIDRIVELSQGKIQVDYYPAQQLGKAQDLLRMCSMGAADIAGVAPSLFAGQVPMNTVIVLPFWTTATEGTRIYTRLMETSPELLQEFLRYGVRPIVTVTTSQYDVGTVNKPVRSPEDLKGLRLKSSGGIFVKIAKRYGITPINIPGPELYEATRRGIVDGNILSYGSVEGYHLNEVEKFHTLGLKMGGFPSTYQINEKVWQKLSQAHRDVILQAAKEGADWFAKTWDDQQKALSDQFEAQGMTIYRIRPEDRKKWFTPLSGIEAEWMEKLEKRGLPAKKVFADFKKLSLEIAGE
ncbi:MAG: TRAP transporter substrate-binding protein DctP [Desulfobacterales bacterium]|nr:TRAP transporter substrate-binding protein DctP [Desulfobacterales bacterium]